MSKIIDFASSENPLLDVLKRIDLPEYDLLCIRKWLAEQLSAYEYAKLGQGGHTNTQIPLRSVFVDLPVAASAKPDHEDGERTQFLAKLLATAPLALSDACRHDLFPLNSRPDIAPGLENGKRANARIIKNAKGRQTFGATLLIGGPGQGKSTLGQLACQLHRAALLKPFEQKLTTAVKELIRSFEVTAEEQVLNQLSLGLPKTRLLPLQVSLPDLAVWLSKENSGIALTATPSIVRFLADLPSAKNAGLTADTLAAFAVALPTLLVLDGFDEVGAVVDRERLVTAANELLKYLAERNGFAQVIATTRPQGYSGEFSKLNVMLRPCFLVPLTRAEALEYARKLVYKKIPGADERAQILQRLNEAATEPATERLLTTPLQVTILAALVQQRGRAPRERWNLFSGYFTYTYARETERHTYASQLLRDYKSHIEQIHARVALLLQVESERAGGASARMSKKRLEEVIDAVLLEAGYEGAERATLVSDIAMAAEQRLVFLVEPEPGSFGFEIRSFQEFMAAWALTSGREAQVEARLFEIAKAPMFRNVTLFAASRLFSEGSHLREIFSSKICAALDEDTSDTVSWVSRGGAVLALETLEEGAALSFPRWARELMNRATGILSLPPGAEHRRLASVATEDIRRVLQDVLEQGLLDPENSSEINASSAWVTLIEATNRNESWAITVGDRLWGVTEGISKILSECQYLELSMGHWLRNKINAHSHVVNPEDFVGFNDSNPTRNLEGWISVILKVYNNEDRWESRSEMIDCFNMRRAGEFRIAHRQLLKEIPIEWEAWCTCALYEMSPSPTSLAAALEALARSPCSTWENIEWRSSWPLVACLRAATDAAGMHRIANVVREGALGTVAEWRRAERSWKSSKIAITAGDVADDMPWSNETLAFSPPLFVLSSWALADKKLPKVTAERLSEASHIFDSTANDTMRRWSARACLGLIKHVDESVPTQNYRLTEWLAEQPFFIGGLFPRPRALQELAWLAVLESAPLPKEVSYVAGFDSLIALINSQKSLPLVLRVTLCTLKYSIGHELRSGAIPGLAQAVTNLPEPLSSNLDVRIIKLFVGMGAEADDDALIAEIILSLNDDEFYLNSVVQAFNDSPFTLDRVTRFFVKLHRSLIGTPYAARSVHELRHIFQARKSKLDSPQVWDALALALPRPVENGEVHKSTRLSAAPVAIRQIDLKDVCGISSLSMEFSRPKSDRGQWIVILGPNGIGKTTLLRSIVLALRDTADPTIWPTSSLSLGWLRLSETSEEMPAEATSTVTLLNDAVYKTTVRSSISTSFARSGNAPTAAAIPIFAYGCRRGSALGGAARKVDLSSQDGPEIATLFDETADLIHAETWLLQLDGDAVRNKTSSHVLQAVIEALCKILNLDQIYIRDKSVWVKERDGPELQLRALSDGYLTSAGWFVDLIARWLELARLENHEVGVDFLSEMTGLVLIDEIDLHLHPRWQIEIVSATRSLLPKMSFVVTTHNPLTLVGADPSEIWILSKPVRDLVVAKGVDTPMLLTGGQIYSGYFGIEDVFPNRMGPKLQRYTFLSRFSMRSDLEEIELQELLDELKAHDIVPEGPIVPRDIVGVI
jgi:energy-coupling factor transporter ATP-binding protein EcfA2